MLSLQLEFERIRDEKTQSTMCPPTITTHKK